jgi:hypothetical protein
MSENKCCGNCKHLKDAGESWVILMCIREAEASLFFVSDSEVVC